MIEFLVIPGVAYKLYLAGVYLSGKHPVCIWRYQGIENFFFGGSFFFFVLFFFSLSWWFITVCQKLADKKENPSPDVVTWRIRGSYHVACASAVAVRVQCYSSALTDCISRLLTLSSYFSLDVNSPPSITQRYMGFLFSMRLDKCNWLCCGRQSSPEKKVWKASYCAIQIILIT